jgi:hypothetical protein
VGFFSASAELSLVLLLVKPSGNLFIHNSIRLSFVNDSISCVNVKASR